jgi:hypothetical protein
MLPFFLMAVAAIPLYPFIPATSTVAALLVLRSLVLAMLAPYGFYYYSTSLYFVGSFMLLPFAIAEWRSRAGKGFPAPATVEQGRV